VKAHVHSITFDKRERPKNAVVITPRGIVHVEWMCAAGDWCWFTSGTGDAIHQCFVPRPTPKRDVGCRYCGKPSEDGSGVCDRCERRYERQ
jgi:hypothetical protein